jgi:tetratricopeptide (TPR) repeat protein
MEKAKDNTGFERAIEQYKAALLAAPWWADAYKKLATAQKAADHYDDAVASLNLYLLTQPADARDAQDEIYKLKALKESAADDQKKAAEKMAEEKRAQQAAAQAAADQAQRQREEQQRAYEASPEGRFQALLKKIDGRRYTCQANDGGTAVLEVRGNVLVSGYIGVKGDYHAFIPNHIEIKSREITVPSNENPFGQVSWTYLVSEDGNSIAVSTRYNDGSVRGPNVYLWQR